LRSHPNANATAAIGFVRRSYASALSRGYGYEDLPRNDRARFDGVAGYFIDFRAKIPSHRSHPNATFEPTDLAQLGLAWWEEVLLGTPHAEEEFQRVCIRIRSEGEEDGQATFWPFRDDVPKYGMRAPWYSAMAQGQMASVLVRAHELLGDAYGDLALRAVEPLLGLDRHGLVAHTPDGPVLEEGAPCTPPSHILNGWIFALWGLWDVATGLGEERARRLYEASLECLIRKLPKYDVGWWTKYSLFPHPTADLAKPFYHRLHIAQAQALARMTDRAEFSDAAERWARYDRRSAAAAAVASKLPFVLLNRSVARRSERYSPAESRARTDE
jgi:heparosan-N-sulfate-glucuronate 5-epimerase